jgi:hypothetical protein
MGENCGQMLVGLNFSPTNQRFKLTPNKAVDNQRQRMTIQVVARATVSKPDMSMSLPE